MASFINRPPVSSGTKWLKLKLIKLFTILLTQQNISQSWRVYLEHPEVSPKGDLLFWMQNRLQTTQVTHNMKFTRKIIFNLRNHIVYKCIYQFMWHVNTSIIPNPQMIVRRMKPLRLARTRPTPQGRLHSLALSPQAGEFSSLKIQASHPARSRGATSQTLKVEYDCA